MCNQIVYKVRIDNRYPQIHDTCWARRLLMPSHWLIAKNNKKNDNVRIAVVAIVEADAPQNYEVIVFEYSSQKLAEKFSG